MKISSVPATYLAYHGYTSRSNGEPFDITRQNFLISISCKLKKFLPFASYFYQFKGIRPKMNSAIAMKNRQ